MSRLERLPRRGHWEVDLVPTPEIHVLDVELSGILLVADRDEGTVRMAAPVQEGEDLGFTLTRAASQPAPPLKPSRPRTIRCRPHLRARLAPAARALGATLQVTQELPAVDEAFEAFRQAFGGPLPLPSDPEAWRGPVQQLMRLAPWEFLPDSVRFHFHGGDDQVSGAVAIVRGLAGAQRGVGIFPTLSDYVRFTAGVHGRPSGRPWRTWAIHLDPIEQLEAPLRRACLERGLVVDGHGLLLMQMKSDDAQLLPPEFEQACLSILQAVIATWEEHGSRLRYEPALARVRTGSGPVTVTTMPPGAPVQLGPEPLLVEQPHRVMLHSENGLSGLIIKAGKRDAERLAWVLEGVDALSFEDTPDGTEIVAWAGELRLGVISRGPFDRGPFAELRTRPWCALVICAGGARRAGVRVSDFLSECRVAIRRNQGSPQAVPGDDLYRPGILDGASWDGPPETWPKASTVLLEFAEPLDIQAAPPRALERAVMLAATIWDAVVLADVKGDPSALDAMRAQVSSQPEVLGLVEHLIHRKRTCYPHDTRLIVVNSCVQRRGRVDVNVKWTLP